MDTIKCYVPLHTRHPHPYTHSSSPLVQSFLGREALIKQQRDGVSRLLGVFAVVTKGDENVVPWGHETIYESGRAVGSLSSAAYGHYLGKYICVAAIRRSGQDGAPCILTQDDLLAGHYEVDIGGKLCHAHLLLQPGYDPKSLKIVS